MFRKEKTPLLPPSGTTRLEPEELEARIAGLVYGLAIGDSLGLGTEGLSRDRIAFQFDPGRLGHSDISVDEFRANWAPGSWTDVSDVAVSVAFPGRALNVLFSQFLLLDSVLQWGGVVDELAFAAALASWWKAGSMHLSSRQLLSVRWLVEWGLLSFGLVW